MEDTNMMTLLITAVIAGVLLFRLMSLLGTRTGHEPPPNPQLPTGDTVVPIRKRDEAKESAALDEESRAVLAQIRQNQPDFDLAHFIDGAKRAYEMLLMAYETGDKATLKPFLSAEVFAAFASAIDQRAAQGLQVEAKFVGIRSADIVSIRLDRGNVEIAVRFKAEIISAMRDGSGEVVAGNPAEVQHISDLWTFARPLNSRDPMWTLVETGD